MCPTNSPNEGAFGALMDRGRPVTELISEIHEGNPSSVTTWLAVAILELGAIRPRPERLADPVRSDLRAERRGARPHRRRSLEGIEPMTCVPLVRADRPRFRFPMSKG